MKRGWISIHRKMQDQWLWNEKRCFSKAEAWIDILFMANHKDNKFLFGNELLSVKTGSFITSELKLMDMWEWSKSKVRAFLFLLESDKMIIKLSDNKKTTISIVNYKDYQDIETAKELQKDFKKTSKELQKDTNNNDNNYNNENNENKRESALDFLNSQAPSRFEAFAMQNKAQVKDWQMMLDSYNDQIDLEIAQNKISFNVDELFPRLSKWCRSWINNQKPKEHNKTKFEVGTKEWHQEINRLGRKVQL